MVDTVFRTVLRCDKGSCMRAGFEGWCDGGGKGAGGGWEEGGCDVMRIEVGEMLVMKGDCIEVQWER